MSAWRKILVFAALAIFIFAIIPRRATPDDKNTLRIGDSSLSLVIESGPRGLATSDITSWIENCARAIAAYYGRFPTSELIIGVKLRNGAGVQGGRVNSGRVPIIRVGVGRHGGARTLSDDWVMVHEMVHLGFPSVRESTGWMEEGLATYVEPVAQARAGLISRERLWYEMLRDMPQGVPASHETGLNNTPTWAATYWGGALFWFLADVEIRQATNGKRGLEHALREILADGGNIQEQWSAERIAIFADRGTGVPVLARLYPAWAEKRGSVDLDALFRRLGVIRHGGSITFDDTAPLAPVRRAIESGA